MKLRIEEVRTEDLVRELSPDALSYFASMELSDEWPSYENTLSGKFVRLGEVILLGAAIDYGEIHRGQRYSLLHLDIMEHGSYGMGEDIAARIKTTAPQNGIYLKEHWPLVDAGWSRIAVDKNGQPIGLKLSDGSYDFGQPVEAIRQKTSEIAQEVLGAE